MSQRNQKAYVGVIGAGSFGTAIANLLAINGQVLLFSRKAELVQKINREHRNFGVDLSMNIRATSDITELTQLCHLIYPIVPSDGFRAMMRSLGPHLKPHHFLIHGTKGFDLHGLTNDDLEHNKINPSEVSTMSQVIAQESIVRRIGCLSGPNLAREIMEGQPTATVIGSKFDEVIDMGKKTLKSDTFHVFGTQDIIGAELAGALKNIIAIGSGILRGRGLGKNIQAMLITRGLSEMVAFGKAFGAENTAFFGTAGIGDLVATATSKDSRNFTFGYRLGQGESRQDIVASMVELAEGVRTLQVTHKLAQHFRLRLPITRMLHEVVFDAYNIDEAIRYLINYPYDVDVDFLD